MKKIKVAAVSYLNTKPLLYGIKRHPVMQDIELIQDYPSKIAQMLIEDKADMGLIPVAVLPRLKTRYIITDYCIGSEGSVGSVCIFSEVPIKEVKKVYLDYQSRTSVSLARVLLHEFWKQDVHFIDAKGEEYRHRIKGSTAGVVIGDRALEQRLESKYIYDLGLAWKQHTGLPFVFAAWVANKKLPDEFIASFNEANAMGLQHLDDVIAENPFPAFDLRMYYTRCISYQLTEEKKKGLNVFLEKLHQQLVG